MSRFRRFGTKLFHRAMQVNVETIRRALAVMPNGSIIADLGCHDGAITSAVCPPGSTVVGLELDSGAATLAHDRGLIAVAANLLHRLPFADESFDAVISNQVIEHLTDTDAFLSETYRILRPGGLVITSTENMSSWHNVFAVALGWQAFSLTNISQRAAGVGNPIALLRDEEPMAVPMQHVRIMSFRGLAELMKAHGFRNLMIRGAGYYPLPARVGAADPRHAAFIIGIGRRPPSRG